MIQGIPGILHLSGLKLKVFVFWSCLIFAYKSPLSNGHHHDVQVIKNTIISWIYTQVTTGKFLYNWISIVTGLQVETAGFVSGYDFIRINLLSKCNYFKGWYSISSYYTWGKDLAHLELNMLQVGQSWLLIRNFMQLVITYTVVFAVWYTIRPYLIPTRPKKTFIGSIKGWFWELLISIYHNGL